MAAVRLGARVALAARVGTDRRGEEDGVEISDRWTRVKGHPVHYRVAGEGDPVVLVHGLSGSSRWWVRNAPAMAKRYRVHLVDLPGFGEMRRRRRSFILAEAASWLLAWMEAVELPWVHLVGHSMGAYICLRCAAQDPRAVRRLVLVSPAGVPSGRSLLDEVGALLRALRHVTPGFLPLLVHDAVQAGPMTLLRAGRDLLAADVREDLRHILAPTLLIWGENDRMTPPTLGGVLREEVAISRLLILKRAGHVPMFDRPREFNAAVLAFLAGDPVGE